MHQKLLALAIALSFAACTQATTPEPTRAPAEKPEVAQAAAAVHALPALASTQFDKIPWKPSNPKAPQGVMVHVISGDPKTGPFNAIVKAPAGLKIPLHTHAAEFHGVTLTGGMVHAAQTGVAQPLAKGSTWVQPGNEPHVDECHSETDCVFLVFFEGPLDTVFVDTPAVDPKMVVTPAADVKWVAVRPEMEKSPMMAVISGNPKEGAFSALFQFPAGMTTSVHTHTAEFSGSVISGVHNRGVSPDQLLKLENGSVWSEKSGAPHMEKCGTEADCVIAVQMDGALDHEDVKLTVGDQAAK